MSTETDPQTDPQADENAAESAGDEPQGDSPSDTTDEGAEGGREARRDGRTRERLRDVEGQVSRLREALTPHARGAVEALVGDRLVDASSIWLLSDLADPLSLLGEDFTVDTGRVDAAVERLLTLAPTLGKRFTGSADGGARSSTGSSSGNGWSALMNPDRKP